MVLNMNFEIKSVFDGLRPHCIVDDYLICSKGYDIFKLNLKSYNLKKIFSINTIRSIFSRSRLISRALRLGISLIKRFKDSFILYCDKGLYHLSDDFSEINRIDDVRSRSYQLMQHNICVTEKYLYFSEYFRNKNRDEISVWKSNNGLNWSKIYTFQKNTIRHIHAIQEDPYKEQLWVCTGDFGKEIFIGKTDYDFNRFEIIGKSEQKYRTIELIFSSDSVYWGTDTPDKENHLIEFSRQNGEVNKLSSFDGPIYNLKKVKNNSFLVFTANEGGKGETDKKAHIWESSNLSEWENLFCLQKDKYPYLMGYGRFLSPIIHDSNIFFTCSSLKNYDNKMIEAEIK